MNVKKLLVTLFLTIAASSAFASDQSTKLDDLINSSSILIEATFDGHPLLAATGREVQNKKDEDAIKHRAARVCTRFGYTTPTAITVEEPGNRIMDVVVLDAEGNFLNRPEAPYRPLLWKENGLDYYSFYYKTFKTIRCSK